MRNLLVGCDNSRRAEIAVKQAVALAEELHARVHLVEAVEPVGPEYALEVGTTDDPAAMLDRVDALIREQDEVSALPDDDFSAAAVRLCEAAGVPCSYQRLHGMAEKVLREQSVAMDMLVVGRQGRSGQRLGATASALITHPLAPTLLCRDELVPWHRLLLAYEPSASGGRALRLAGELSAQLNLALDVIVADTSRQRARKNLDYARRTLRAFHVEGEYEPHEGRPAPAIQSAAAELQSSVVVVPHRRSGLLTSGPSEAVRAAIECPTALALIVP